MHCQSIYKLKISTKGHTIIKIKVKLVVVEYQLIINLFRKKGILKLKMIIKNL